MGVILSVDMGWGIELPERFLDNLTLDRGFLEEAIPYYWGEPDADAFAVFAKSTLKTFYGANVHPHYNPPLPTAQEVLALKDLQERIDYDVELKPLMMVSLV